ncbi:MAG: hypothetical protein CL678_09375 [Bdellovibrionaceae bacterium]|nr:hypothetical protein [Pseudobdellovibrionaceae bacterium]|tara:strand:- start:6369 stop:6950 length:582 start_codon:yes stop_codon:yes gene_type:complete
MNKQVKLECFCGKLKGTLQVASNKPSFHVECLCCDCQNFAAYLKQENRILDKYGSTELFQTYPSYIEFSEGSEQIACVKLTEKGLMRWYASCCNSPIANTMSSSKIPFAGISVKLMKFESETEKESTLGPVIMKAFAKYAIGSKPQGSIDRFPLSFIPKILTFMAKGFLGRKYTPHPFFKQGTPVSLPKVLNP